MNKAEFERYLVSRGYQDRDKERMLIAYEVGYLQGGFDEKAETILRDNKV